MIKWAIVIVVLAAVLASYGGGTFAGGLSVASGIVGAWVGFRFAQSLGIRGAFTGLGAVIGAVGFNTALAMLLGALGVLA